MTRLPAVLTLLLALPAATAADLERSEARRFPAADGKRVVLELADHDVDVRSGDGAEITVGYDLQIVGIGAERAARWIEAHTPVFSDAPEELRATAAGGDAGLLNLGVLVARSRVSALLPPETVPDVTTTSGRVQVSGRFPGAAPLRLRSATGDLGFEGTARSVDVRTSSGDTRLDVHAPLADLFVRSAGGDVTLTGGAAAARIDTSSGEVWLRGLSGPAEVRTVDGDVTLRWSSMDADCTVRVSSEDGKIRLTLPPGTSPSGELRSTTGSIHSDFPGTVAVEGTAVMLAGDGPRIEVVTTSGDIILTADQPPLR